MLGPNLHPISYCNVRLTTGLLATRQRINTRTTLPIVYQQCQTTGRIDAWRLVTHPALPGIPKPHKFWDSDLAKWIEAAAYSLALTPDPALRKKVDATIDLLAAAQQPDGYLNLHFTVNEPAQRWTNLRDDHELYCAAHLMEAAVALHESTGDRRLLDVICRYADYIATVFGPGPHQKKGYCGHPEIELALVRLFHATGRRAYLDLAKFFLDQRGTAPHYFDREAAARGEPPQKPSYTLNSYAYYQAHQPIRQQKTAEGHAVRLAYLFAGATDVAAATADRPLLRACQTVFNNITTRRMYIHGGIGSQHRGERFSFDYDLPNEDAYAETCAQIALVFLAHRLLHADPAPPQARYADILERCLYNSILPGVSLDGTRFFYDNYLAACPPWHHFARRNPPTRQPWFGCACCPPNIARLLASLGGYLYSQSDSELRLHLYAASTLQTSLAGTPLRLTQDTRFPWDGTITLRLAPARPTPFTLSLRLPGWCRSPKLSLNGRPLNLSRLTKNGYASLRRTWQKGDRLTLTLPMPIQRLYAHPRVRHDTGRVALMRGPILYCLEQADNGPDLNTLALPKRARITPQFNPHLLNGVTTLSAPGTRLTQSDWKNALYRTTPAHQKPATLKFIPYFTWANRTLGEMLVWLREM